MALEKTAQKEKEKKIMAMLLWLITILSTKISFVVMCICILYVMKREDDYIEKAKVRDSKLALIDNHMGEQIGKLKPDAEVKCYKCGKDVALIRAALLTNHWFHRHCAVETIEEATANTGEITG